MPYVDKATRIHLQRGVAGSPGELNYIIHEVLDEYFTLNGVSYSSINSVVGVLECVKLELYRRLAAPYEDKKKEENGDISLYESFGGK